VSWDQLSKSKAAALIAAVVIVLTLGAFQATRRYAVWVGVIIMAVWFFKWQRQGGRLS
jgi:hypothetical protein